MSDANEPDVDDDDDDKGGNVREQDRFCKGFGIVEKSNQILQVLRQARLQVWPACLSLPSTSSRDYQTLEELSRIRGLEAQRRGNPKEEHVTKRHPSPQSIPSNK